MRRDLLLVALLTIPASALASDGHGFEREIPGYYLVDFIVLMTIITYFAGKPIMAFLQTRRTNLMREIEEADALKQEANKRLEEYTRRLASLDEEREAIQQDFRRDGERERDRILAEAEDTAARLVEDAGRRIEGETRRLQIALEAEAVQLAVNLVETTVKERMDAAMQARLIEESIQGIESLNEGSLGPRGA